MHLHGELNHVYRGECAMFRPGPDNPMVPAGDVADGVWCMSVRVCVCVAERKKNKINYNFGSAMGWEGWQFQLCIDFIQTLFIINR